MIAPKDTATEAIGFGGRVGSLLYYGSTFSKAARQNSGSSIPSPLQAGEAVRNEEAPRADLAACGVAEAAWPCSAINQGQIAQW